MHPSRTLNPSFYSLKKSLEYEIYFQYFIISTFAKIQLTTLRLCLQQIHFFLSKMALLFIKERCVFYLKKNMFLLYNIEI